MRDLVLKRIEEIKKKHNDFSKDLVRWRLVSINGVHISSVDFSSMDDKSLLEAFEFIIMQSSKQM